MTQRFRGSSRSSGRFSGMRESFGAIDRMLLILFFLGAYIILAGTGPSLLRVAYSPADQWTVTCTDLAAPLGGNNRSMLAQAGGNTQNLALELLVENDPVPLGGTLRVSARFANNDIGPVILYLTPQTPPISSNPDMIGLRLEIKDLNNNMALPESSDSPTPPGWNVDTIPSDQLHLLGSRALCHQTISINVSQLQPGDYRVRAYYFNDYSGKWQSNFTARDQPSPTPAYTDQGVWTARNPISSSEIRFTIGTPGP
jgi:hypothetical protein